MLSTKESTRNEKTVVQKMFNEINFEEITIELISKDQ